MKPTAQVEIPSTEQQIKPELPELVQIKQDEVSAVVKTVNTEDANKTTKIQNKRKLSINDNKNKCSQTLKKLIVEQEPEELSLKLEIDEKVSLLMEEIVDVKNQNLLIKEVKKELQLTEEFTVDKEKNDEQVGVVVDEITEVKNEILKIKEEKAELQLPQEFPTELKDDPEQVDVIVESNSKTRIKLKEIVIQIKKEEQQCPKEFTMKTNSEQVGIVDSLVKKEKLTKKKNKEGERERKLRKLAADLSDQKNSGDVFIFPDELVEQKTKRPTNTTIELFSTESKLIHDVKIEDMKGMDVQKEVDKLVDNPNVATNHVMEPSAQLSEQVDAAVKDEIENNQVKKVESDGMIDQTIQESEPVKHENMDVNQMEQKVGVLEQADVVVKKEVVDVVMEKDEVKEKMELTIEVGADTLSQPI